MDNKMRVLSIFACMTVDSVDDWGSNDGADGAYIYSASALCGTYLQTCMCEVCASPLSSLTLVLLKTVWVPQQRWISQ